MHYLDGVDPEKCCWVEFNNIAWDLGYRVRPISYWFKLPRCAKWEGFHPINNDVDAVEMTKHIPPRKRIMQLFITGGGPRKIKDAEVEDIIPAPFGWHNPQNILLPSEVEKKNGSKVDNDDMATGNDDDCGYVADEEAKAKRSAKGKAKVVEEAEATKAKKQKGKKKAENYNTRFKGEKSVDASNFEDETTDEEDNDFFVQSDYEQDDKDDEIFFENEIEEPDVVEEYGEMGYGGEISDDYKGSDEDLTSIEGSETEEDENGNKVPIKRKGERKFKQFHPEVDMKNPVMKFANSRVLKKAIREYAIINRKRLWIELNRKEKIQAKCGWSRPLRKRNKKNQVKPANVKMNRVVCPWRLYASRYDDEHPESLMIKSFVDEHNCGGVSRVYHLTSTWMAKRYVHEWRLNPNWSVEGFQQQVASDYGMSISQQIVYRTKQKAGELNAGAYRDQYNKLESYAAEIRRSNPGTSVYIHSEMEGEIRNFKRIYICWDACKKGFKSGCRKLLGFDGCHIKGAYPGQLLATVGIDANNGMYPIAYAIVEIENKETWSWFMELVIEDLEIVNDTRYVIISDKQKGLLPAAESLFPNAEHRHCVRHLYNNFKSDFPGIGLKQMLWSAARDTTSAWWNKHIEEMKTANWDAWDWLAKKNPSHWSKAWFNDLTKCDLLVNNLCESFNSSILKSRDKPILHGLEMIRINMMVRMSNRRNAGARWNGVLGPRVQKILKKYREKSQIYNVAEGSHHQFQITGKESHNMHAVDLAKRTCTCRRWDISGIPCQHAIAAIYVKDEDSAVHLDNCYSQEKYLEAYNPIIHPIAGEDYWPVVVAPLEPPPYKAQPGRPKKVRFYPCYCVCTCP